MCCCSKGLPGKQGVVGPPGEKVIGIISYSMSHAHIVHSTFHCCTIKLPHRLTQFSVAEFRARLVRREPSDQLDFLERLWEFAVKPLSHSDFIHLFICWSEASHILPTLLLFSRRGRLEKTDKMVNQEIREKLWVHICLSVVCRSCWCFCSCFSIDIDVW